MDLDSVRKFIGHASILQTSGYNPVTAQDVKQVADVMAETAFTPDAKPAVVPLRAEAMANV